VTANPNGNKFMDKTQQLKNAKIVFIDDQKTAISPFMSHLNDEGFSNVTFLKSVRSFNEVVQLGADLVFLDITGVATTLDEEDEGLSVLGYLKKHRPWTRVVVLSGSDFPASKARQLSQADLCVTKASLKLAELVNVTEDQLRHGLAPEFRYVQILEVIESQLDDLNLGWWTRWRLQKLIETAKTHRGDTGFDWSKLSAKAQGLPSTASNVATVVSFLGA
jgi:CheY-like chemotaxis protein